MIDTTKNIQLFLGDCLEVMKEIPDKSIDMILCDLPYGITARNKWDIILDFNKLWEQYNRIRRGNTAMIFTATQPFASLLVCSNKSLFKYEWIWQKTTITGVLNAKIQPVRNHEQILVFYESQPTYNPQNLIKVNKITKQGTSSKNYGQRTENNEYFQEYSNYPRTVQLVASEGKKLHPTQKPVALMEYLIKTYTNEGHLILDNCMGSGTTGVACKNSNRRFIGIEKEEQYMKIAQERIKNANREKEDRQAEKKEVDR
jgi:site-specific DNA-methyltransferase (adenine-specific)